MQGDSNITEIERSETLRKETIKSLNESEMSSKKTQKWCKVTPIYPKESQKSRKETQILSKKTQMLPKKIQVSHKETCVVFKAEYFVRCIFHFMYFVTWMHVIATC